VEETKQERERQKNKETNEESTRDRCSDGRKQQTFLWQKLRGIKVAVLEIVCRNMGLLLNLAAVIQNWGRLRNFKKSAEGVEQRGE